MHNAKSPPFSVVNSQQNSGIVYQEAVALKHTIFVVGSADIDKRIRSLIRLFLAWEDTMEFDRRIFSRRASTIPEQKMSELCEASHNVDYEKGKIMRSEILEAAPMRSR